MEIEYTKQAQKDLEYWRKSGNVAVQSKISRLLEDIKKTPFLRYRKTGAFKIFFNRILEPKNKFRAQIGL